ncbi:hypothetical protein HBI56_057360 [Parastagonospora nodorum]|nr:hypothetical protein HBH53_150340 [Parastagonospora nodorum]KAH3967096.1 hypothetical protein HBH51_141760 [Parastagonospora nodorum]KAH4003034.1 hypothetical protein HBI10_070340 [Parastagonospora nodorum]KAH4027916.1 hypothetical protein HBI13_047680 [Parastagonospora nodorum]KAH4091962.1 hypothetical protein HBH46_183390 [Parastagonospora nodorum]
MNTPHTSVNVFATCRQVNTEVSSPMANKLAELSPLPRVIVEVDVYLLLVARDRDNNGKIDLSDALVFALKRAENWMDGKALGLVACMQKWFVLFERQRLMVGQHSTLDSVPTVEMGIRNANFGVEYGLVYHSTRIFLKLIRSTPVHALCQRIFAPIKSSSSLLMSAQGFFWPNSQLRSLTVRRALPLVQGYLQTTKEWSTLN